MKLWFIISTLFLIMMLPTLHGIQAQSFEPDPEAQQIRSRVLNVTWEIENIKISSLENPTNESIIQFVVNYELWNPYDRELVTYGSSSCRWVSYIELIFSNNIEIENSGEICTADYGPRFYPSGISTEQSHPSIVFLNQFLKFIPNGNITINGQGGTFNNSTDYSYGVNIGFKEGNKSFYFEHIPANWGEILFYDIQATVESKLNSPYNSIVISIIFFVMGKKLTFRKDDN